MRCYDLYFSMFSELVFIMMCLSYSLLYFLFKVLDSLVYSVVHKFVFNQSVSVNLIMKLVQEGKVVGFGSGRLEAGDTREDKKLFSHRL